MRLAYFFLNKKFILLFIEFCFICSMHTIIVLFNNNESFRILYVFRMYAVMISLFDCDEKYIGYQIWI